MYNGIVTPYYETETMSTELREAISVTFDRNMTLLGDTFEKRLSWIYDNDIRQEVYYLYISNLFTDCYWRNTHYETVWDSKNRVPKVVIKLDSWLSENEEDEELKYPIELNPLLQ